MQLNGIMDMTSRQDRPSAHLSGCSSGIRNSKAMQQTRPVGKTDQRASHHLEKGKTRVQLMAEFRARDGCPNRSSRILLIISHRSKPKIYETRPFRPQTCRDRQYSHTLRNYKTPSEYDLLFKHNNRNNKRYLLLRPLYKQHQFHSMSTLPLPIPSTLHLLLIHPLILCRPLASQHHDIQA